MWQALTAWSVVQKVARESVWSFQKDTEVPAQLRSDEAGYYCKYAVAIYGKSLIDLLKSSKFLDLFNQSSPKRILMAYTGIPEEDVVFIDSESQPFFPAYAVCIDRARESIVLVVRGTLSITDCLTDLKASYVPYSVVDPLTQEVKATGTVHEGIYKGACNVFNTVKPLLLEMQQLYPSYSLIITGHSLGAGTASLIGLLMKSDANFAGVGFRVYAYGPPCIVSQELHHLTKENILTVSQGSDLVTRACFGSIKDLVNLILFFNKREGESGKLTASQIVKDTILRKDIDPNELIAVYLQAKRELTNPKHLPPGFILQIYDKFRNTDADLLPVSDNEYVAGFALPSFYNEIIFSKTVLSDHMPDVYERALNSLLRSSP
mmetsp:Transcript_26843/g.48394  ORF Transcript_26843/g.48394 Transcript_26843/m.48394 type:complete len:377 (-) Transcript_26843:2-1132(-)